MMQLKRDSTNGMASLGNIVCIKFRRACGVQSSMSEAKHIGNRPRGQVHELLSMPPCRQLVIRIKSKINIKVVHNSHCCCQCGFRQFIYIIQDLSLSLLLLAPSPPCPTINQTLVYSASRTRRLASFTGAWWVSFIKPHETQSLAACVGDGLKERKKCAGKGSETCSRSCELV